MHFLTRLEPIDYLLIGHLSRDLTPDGERLGGTVAYAARMAYALGLRVGMITSWGNEFSLDPYLGELPIINIPTESSTSFENRETPGGRVQRLFQVASSIGLQHIPEIWREVPILHLAPLAQEVDPSLVRYFPASLICATAQGWLREWDQEGWISPAEWPEASFVLSHTGAVVISASDVNHNKERIEEMVTASRVLVVTEGAAGARVYWNGDVRRFRPPQITASDTVGAGDIFATAFFCRLHFTSDPWEAARFATLLASLSVTRSGIASIPSPEEIQSATVEVF
jgi:sugar/nucleoside kinase (ribokinase family)